MVSRSKLYDAFGELIYAIALADGDIQDSEVDELNKILMNHPWSKEITWSFLYEQNKHHSVEAAFNKAMDIFKEHGPDPEYKFMVDVMIKVAEAFQGIVPEEQALINRFQKELKDKFLRDTSPEN